MRIFTVILLFSLLSHFKTSAQDITGQWNGVLKVQGMSMRLTFNISMSANVYSSTMDSPDQGAKGIPTSSTSFINETLTLEIASANIQYVGILKENKILGTFTQGGQNFPLDLSRNIIEKELPKRPQEPLEPYPYYTEDVTFQNAGANITLSGTLSLPKKEGSFPVVVLISGSGPQNRDEEILGHKPFLVISDHLVKNGIAVLRFDDRGVGKSNGDFKSATSADFASDVESAIAYLKNRKEIDKTKIGLIGHSEGGIIAPLVASRTKEIKFIVLLAGVGISGNELLLLQQEVIGRESGVPEIELKKSKETNSRLFEMIMKSKDTETLKRDVTNLLVETIKNDGQDVNGVPESEFISKTVDQLTSSWMQFFIKYNPTPILNKVKCPVLAMNGEKDLQVSAKENLAAIKKSLTDGGNKYVSIIELPNLNHLFQECKTGLPSEYGEIEQTFSPSALGEMTNWITTAVK